MNRFMLGIGSLVAIVIFLGSTWWLAPKIAIVVQSSTQSLLPACGPNAGTDECEKSFAKLGQTGDLFAVISSLFSGIALLTVALTLWLETRGRRHSRKPLIVCQINEDKPVVFDEPSTTNPRAIRISFNLDVHALNDVAMNASIKAIISSNVWKQEFSNVFIPVPLTGAEITKISLPFALRLDHGNITQFLAALRRDQRIGLDLISSFTNLEGVKWHTSMSYVLTFRPTDLEKLLALDGDGDRCAEMWKNQAIVQANSQLRHDSWRHYR